MRNLSNHMYRIHIYYKYLPPRERRPPPAKCDKYVKPMHSKCETTYSNFISHDFAICFAYSPNTVSNVWFHIQFANLSDMLRHLFRIHSCQIWFHILLTALIRTHLGYVAALQMARIKNVFVDQNGSDKLERADIRCTRLQMAHVACLFRFDWNPGFAKISWPDESTRVY